VLLIFFANNFLVLARNRERVGRTGLRLGFLLGWGDLLVLIVLKVAVG